MKRLFITLFIALSTFAAFGQGKADDIGERYFDAKIREFVYRLHMSDQQKEQFVPIYRRYSEEMRAAVGAPREKGAAHGATTEEAAALAKERIERQQAAQTVRMKYVDEFATVLNPDQLSRLYVTESQIQRKLLSRKSEHQGIKDRQHGSR